MRDELLERIEHEMDHYEGPVLLFDLQHASTRAAELRALEPAFDCSFLMAAKAFAHPAVYAWAARELAGFDVSNGAEYNALPADLGTRLVVLTDPTGIPTAPGALTAKGNRLLVTVDGALDDASLPRDADFLVRLDAASLLGSPPLGNGLTSRFGATAAEVVRAAAALRAAGDRFRGFHVHHGRDDHTADSLATIAQEMARLAAALSFELRCVDLGGGLHALDEAEIATAVRRVRAQLPTSAHLVFEPGQHLFRGAGFAVCQVRSLKPVADGYHATVDLSASNHLRWSRVRLLWMRPERSTDRARLRVFGATCYELDVVGDFSVPAGSVREGDVLVLSNVSSYSASWNSGFNGIPPARIEILDTV